MGRKPCCDKSLNNRGSWTQEEDDLLVQYISTHGHSSWRSLPKAAGLRRCGKSCRLRWINYLRPDLKRGNFTNQEDEIIIDLHQMLGNKWSLIARRLPGRTDNEIKNHWNGCIRWKLIDRGIDPNTHRAINKDADQSRKRRQRRPRKQPARPKKTQEPNNQPRVEEEERTNPEQQPPLPMQQIPEVEPPREEEDHINLELTLALSPTPPQPAERPELRRTTAVVAAAGPSGGAGTVCEGCSQLIRREGSDNSRNCVCQLLKLSL